ncbi:late competence development ComFB family protein [Pseudoalteromonas denitrificans]|uniref:Late competence development protein ComFB n=1 Tax=Pseudoalteromonas denitrificans DSM 6059 TaxID=1123010 RepID=A0A1I1I1J5_9GAMM|nr:late competence development ComFB family protein [Pseudoalteromonas denitrificans]SFC30064.1 Late competence development protein ComFB [Pseudoalteromonas denitrificans DSM 6059]
MKMHDDIHNYYEKLVLDEIIKQKLNETIDVDTLADFCCTVLNQLPPRYIRYEVDMAFYLPQSERVQMENKVKAAITESRKLISMRSHSE